MQPLIRRTGPDTNKGLTAILKLTWHTALALQLRQGRAIDQTQPCIGMLEQFAWAL